jgi:hypothetical protein
MHILVSHGSGWTLHVPANRTRSRGYRLPPSRRLPSSPPVPPPHPTLHSQWEAIQDHYKGREIQLYDLSDPMAAAYRAGPRFDAQSAYAEQYPAHPPQAPHPGPPAVEYKPSPYRLDDNTTCEFYFIFYNAS